MFKNPQTIISRLPLNTEIPGLKQSLLSVLKQYEIQVSIPRRNTLFNAQNCLFQGSFQIQRQEIMSTLTELIESLQCCHKGLQ